MNQEKIKRLADWLDVALEQMDEESVEYEFVADSKEELIDETW